MKQVRSQKSEVRSKKTKHGLPALGFRLYLITDRKQFRETSHFSLPTSHLMTAIRQSLKGGVKAIQLREKDLETRELLKLAYRMRELTEKYNAKLFINDRSDIALAVGADGVHLTQNSIPADAVRKAVHSSLVTRHSSPFLIGVSTHSLKEAKEAEKAGADFITFGPIYKTPSKLKYGKPPGLDTLKKVSRKIKVPVFAIGGIKSHRVNEAKNAGAYGVAMISEILGADDIKGKTREMIGLLEDIN
ncbi:MAG: thiamine phosphate synthase [Nitrospirae bacterium]|nr:thiamine phosphate synthase [Nitrospirota bacterium]